MCFVGRSAEQIHYKVPAVGPIPTFDLVKMKSIKFVDWVNLVDTGYILCDLLTVVPDRHQVQWDSSAI